MWHGGSSSKNVSIIWPHPIVAHFNNLSINRVNVLQRLTIWCQKPNFLQVKRNIQYFRKFLICRLTQISNSCHNTCKFTNIRHFFATTIQGRKLIVEIWYSKLLLCLHFLCTHTCRSSCVIASGNACAGVWTCKLLSWLHIWAFSATLPESWCNRNYNSTNHKTGLPSWLESCAVIGWKISRGSGQLCDSILWHVLCFLISTVFLQIVSALE